MENIGRFMTKYRGEMLETLGGLIAIPSVRGEAENGKPFGDGPYRALGYMLGVGERMGLRTYSADGCAGHAEYGDGEETAAAVVHLDVVPAGDGWKTPAFALTERGGYLYGRGVSDDKGSAVAALYALGLIRELGIRTDRKIRVIFGCGEETGMDDLPVYFTKQDLPVLAFTPDVGTPLINREKGRLIYRFQTSYDAARAAFKSFQAGNAPNMVPDRCTARISADAAAEVGTNSELQLKMLENGCEIRAEGKSAHASSPEKGVNAAAPMLSFAARAEREARLKSFFAFLSECIGRETDGASMGVSVRDELSGALTLNLGMVHAADGSAYADIDIRYPVTADGNRLVSALAEKAGLYGVSGETIRLKPPLHVPADSELVTRLTGAFEMFRKTPCIPCYTGGGTYARIMDGHCVSFCGMGENEHQPNERLSLEEFMECAQVYAQALYSLAMH